MLIGLYGTQVCPFVESLPFTALALPLVCVFALLFAVRSGMNHWQPATDLRTVVKKQFKSDLGLFVAGGLCLAVFNFLVHDFPVGSGFKIILGMSVLGFFVACDLGLRREHSLAAELSASGHHIEIDQSRPGITKPVLIFCALNNTLKSLPIIFNHTRALVQC